MSDRPHAKSAHEAGHEDAPATARGRTPSRWTPFVTPAIALIALIVAIAGWFHSGQQARSFSDEQTATAKKQLCSAYTGVHKAVVINTHLANPGGVDPSGQLAVAANARLALLGGGTYLRGRLAAEPATPADLAKAVEAFADTTEQLGLNYLADATDFVQKPLRQDLNSEITQLDGLCK